MNPLAELPLVSTDRTLAESRHRFVRAPCLRLRVTDLPLATLVTFELGADGPLLLRSHGCAHVLFHDQLILLLTLRALQLIVRHDYQFCCGDFAFQHSLS